MTKKIVAVTACPTGVAHTFMAAEALEIEARKRGDWIKVETRGSVGAKNTLTAEEIAQADVVIIAADIELDLSGFVGKRLYRTSTGAALKKSAQEMDNAFNSAEVYQGSAGRSSSAGKTELPGVYKHLMTGVSHMLPLVVAGGLCIALSFVFGIQAFNEPGTLAAALFQIGGKAAFALMVPVLAGFIAFSIADRPGLARGLLAGCWPACAAPVSWEGLWPVFWPVTAYGFWRKILSCRRQWKRLSLCWFCRYCLRWLPALS